MNLREFCATNNLCLFCLKKDTIKNFLAEKKVSQKRADKLFRELKQRDSVINFYLDFICPDVDETTALSNGAWSL